MKRHLTILIFVFLSSSIYAQQLDRTYFLLGTLHDYMGRNYAKNNPTNFGYILKLHEKHLGEILRIEEVTGLKFNKTKTRKDCSNCDEFYELNSILKSKQINSFYSFKKDKGMRDLMGFSFFTGKLKCKKINSASENETISFIAGLFLTDGRIENKIYKITLYNSPDRYECIKQILKKLDCEILNSQIVEGIPYSFQIDFIPTEKIKKLLDNEIEKRNTLANKGYK